MGKININLKEILIFVCILIFMYIIYKSVIYYKYRSIRNNEVVDDDDDEVHDDSMGPAMCDPKVIPPEMCPGGIPCPQCNKPACPCPPPGQGPPPGPPPTPGPNKNGGDITWKGPDLVNGTEYKVVLGDGDCDKEGDVKNMKYYEQGSDKGDPHEPFESDKNWCGKPNDGKCNSYFTINKTGGRLQNCLPHIEENGDTRCYADNNPNAFVKSCSPHYLKYYCDNSKMCIAIENDEQAPHYVKKLFNSEKECSDACMTPPPKPPPGPPPGPPTIKDCDVSKLSKSDKLSCISASSHNDNYYMGKINNKLGFIKENASKDTLKTYKDLCKVQGCYGCACGAPGIEGYVGKPFYGAICKVNNLNKCTSCTDGYNLVGDDCVLNKCTCPNGTAVVPGTDCHIDGYEKCEKCNTGYELKDNKCEKIPPHCNATEVDYCGGSDRQDCVISKTRSGGKWYDCRYVDDVPFFEDHCQKSESPC